MGKNKLDQSSSDQPEKTAPPAKKAGAFQVSNTPLAGEPIENEAHKYDIGPEADHVVASGTEPPAYEDLGELPATYHQDALFLTARDPRWLFCYWDFDWMRVAKSDFRGGVAQFFLKITTTAGADESLVEIKPAARNWYVPVSAPATGYVAELGWFDPAGAWHGVVRSGPATTPADELAPDSAASEFATVPLQLSFERMLELVRERMEDGESMLEAVARIAGEGRIEFGPGHPPTWTDEQKRLLSALLGDSLLDRAGLGSAELDQLLRKTLQQKLHSESASGLSLRFAESMAPGPHSLFSGGWGASWSAQPFSILRERGFFMHVNAEIIFYGGTHPDATVWIDGKEIPLSPDGTFRYHYRLPDGEFAIPIVAQSPDGVEQRTATLGFTRGTARVGDVGATDQPPYLGELIGRK